MLRRSLAAALLALALAAPALALEQPHREVLPNGLTLVVLPTRASPTVSLNVFVKVGSFEETPETSGIAHFYEHLFFRGTPSISGFQFKRAIEAIGGTTNASTTRDFTHYYINLPKAYVDQGLDLLADALINAELSPESIDQERKAVLEEYKLGEESPARIINGRIFDMAYGEHPYGKPIIGTLENINRFQREDFVRFRDSFYSPQRSSVVIVGDVRPEEILPRARELFGSFERENPVPDTAVQVNPRPEEEIRITESLPSRNCFVILGYQGPSVKDRPDIYQVDVMSFLLGVGRGSLLTRNLVDEDKALEASVDFLTQRYPGLIVVAGVGEPGQEGVLRENLLSVVDQVRRGEFTDRDLQRAKTFLRTSYIYGNETNAGKADSIGFYAAIDDLDFATSYLAEVDKVTREDVIAAANKYLGPGYYCLIMQARGAEGTRASR